MANFWSVNVKGAQYVISPYQLVNGLGLIIGLLLLDNTLKKKFPHFQKKAYILFVVTVVFGWIGAHISDCVINSKPFARAGFMFYGGLISGIFFYIIACGKSLGRKLILPTLNAAVIPFVIAHAVGRIGCFWGGCCHGIQFTKSNFLTLFFYSHPTQLYESAFLFSLFIFLIKLKERHPLSLIYIYLTSYGLFRFLIEFLRGDDRSFFNGLSHSQWISLLILLALIIKWVTQRARQSNLLKFRTRMTTNL
jgi:phosphatidylglycerol:prolipoprotein diacylglycerol transferase